MTLRTLAQLPAFFAVTTAGSVLIGFVQLAERL